jgi:outer membrane protein assembly factor BamB
MKRLFLLLLLCAAVVYGWYYLSNYTNNWTSTFGYTGTNSSPRAVDLNLDGTLDIVLGAGWEEYDTTNYAVIALDGKNGDLLWSVPGPNQMVGSAIFKDVNKDHVPEVFIGGRSAQFYCIDGRSGKILWKYLDDDYVSPNSITDTLLLNFHSPQFIPDQNGDGEEDLLTAFGGFVYAHRDDDNRPSGQLLVLDALTGRVIKQTYAPDGKEIYMSPVIYDFKNGKGLSIIFGTGGETISGNLYRVALDEFMHSGMEKVVRIDSGGDKGFIAPPVIIDITNDGVGDIVVTSMNGKMRAYDGSSLARIWCATVHPRAEVQAMPVPVFYDNDEIPDFFSTFNLGGWPFIGIAMHAILSGVDGSELFKDTLGKHQISSPVLLDFNEDSNFDIVSQVNIHLLTPSFADSFQIQLIVYDAKTGTTTPINSAVNGKNLGSTPLVTDLDKDGKVDVIYTYMTEYVKLFSYKHLVIKRLELDIKLYSNPWGGYMGTDYSSVFRE